MNWIQLLRLEWLKYRNNRTFIASLILFAILLPSSVMVILSIGELPEPFPKPRSFFNFPKVWDLVGYAGNWLAYFIFGFLGVYMITIETSSKTLRQGVINGLSRGNLIAGKLMFLLVLALASTVYYMLCTFLLGNLGTEPFAGGPLLGEDWIIFRFFLMIFAYLIFGFLIGLITRSMGIGILIYFIYVFFIEVAIRHLAHANIIEHKSMNFYPMNAVEDLTPLPIMEYTDIASNYDFSLFLTPTEAIITSTAYSLIFIAICYQIITRRDL